MRNFTNQNQHWYLWNTYIYRLDQQVWNLYDYIKEYNPNYIILNDESNYYNRNELQELTVLDKNYDQIKAYKLNNHQGIINNFGKTVFLDFNGVNQGLIIPLNDNHYITQPDTTLINLNSSIQNININDWKWNAHQLYPLLEGYLLLSQVTSNDWSHSSIDRQQIQKYLIGRVAAPATYYIWNKIQWIPSHKVSDIDPPTPSYIQYNWQYCENAEINYGTIQWLSFLPTDSRFYYDDLYNNIEPKPLEIQYTEIKNTDIKLYPTDDSAASYWVKNYLLWHQLYNQKSDNNHSYCEEIIADDIVQIKDKVFDKQSTPTYTINILNQNQEVFLGKFPMRVRLW